MTSPPMRKLLLEALHISRVYRTGQPDETLALRDVSMRIYAGDYLAILGTRGAGKTTLLRILGLQDRPTTGTLHLEGRLVSELTDAEMAAARLPADRLQLIDDPPNHAELLKRLRQANQAGLTIVLATDDPEVAAHATGLFRIENGMIYAIGG